MQKFEIINLNAFVVTTRGELGIAEQGTFAAMGWLLSDEAFKNVSGTKFSWIALDGNSYVDGRDIFRRPTTEQVMEKMNVPLLNKAISLGHVKLAANE
jgi:hypothetical protein